MRNWASVVLVAASLGSAAPAAAMYPSPITLWFAGDTAAVAQRLAGMCASLHAEVISQSGHRLQCQRAANPVDKMAVQMTGQGYPGSSTINLTFEFAADRGEVRVDTLHYVAVQQQTLGYTHPGGIYSYGHPKVRRAMTDLLVAMGGSSTRPRKL